MDHRKYTGAIVRRAGLLILLLAMLPGSGLPAFAATAPDPAALAARIHQEVNIARREQGLPILAWEPALGDIAQQHSIDMARRRYFSHASPEGTSMRERYAQAAFECEVQVGEEIHLGAENIALHSLYRRKRIDSDGQRHYEWLDDAALARRVVQGWLASAGHRRNILSVHWRREGIGIAINVDNDVLITQNFC